MNAASEQAEQAPKPLVLVIDDDSSNLALIAGALQDRYRVRSAQEPTRALALVAEARDKPDLILLDVMMPGMSGLELLARLRAAPHSADIPVIFVTADDSLDSELRAFESGAEDYVLKPVVVPTLRARVRNTIARRHAERALAESHALLTQVQHVARLGHWRLDLASGELYWSAETYAIFEIDPLAFEPSYEGFLAAVHPDDRTRVDAAFTRAVQAHLPYEITHRLLMADGRIKWVFERGDTEYGPDGCALRARGTLQDITESLRNQEWLHLLEAAFNASANAIVITDRQARIRWANPAFSALTGYAPDEICGHNPAELVRSGVQGAAFYETLWRTIMAGQVWRGELINRRKDGSLYHEEMTITPVFDEGGQIRHFIAVKEDISARKASEAAAEQARREIDRLSARNALLLASAGQGIYGVDEVGRCTFINPAALSVLGYREDELLGQLVHDIIHARRLDGETYPFERCPVALTLADGLTRKMEDAFVRRDGAHFPVQMVVTPIVEAGQRVGAEVVFDDISQRKAMEAELTRLATTDALTGVANRRHFVAELEREFARLKRFGKPASLMMLDIDHFKRINDTWGHAGGDQVLRHFAGLISAALRRIDLFGRMGGEEFAILLPGTGQVGALELGERLRRLVAEHPAATTAGPVSCTVSIGLAECEPGDDNPDQVLIRADQALYAAKAGGRNQVRVAS